MTQKMEWKNQPEDYDYQQEVARAAFADMLHDDERVINDGAVQSLLPTILQHASCNNSAH